MSLLVDILDDLSADGVAAICTALGDDGGLVIFNTENFGTPQPSGRCTVDGRDSGNT